MKKYTYRDETRFTGEVEADTLAEAIELAKAETREGEWGDAGGTVDVWITDPDDGEETYIEVSIEPNHRAMILAVGGDPDCDHDWVATLKAEGGIAENPGVWGIGGAAVSISDHCRRCGLRRNRVEGDTNPPNAGGQNGIEYYEPDEALIDTDNDDTN